MRFFVLCYVMFWFFNHQCVRYKWSFRSSPFSNEHCVTTYFEDSCVTTCHSTCNVLLSCYLPLYGHRSAELRVSNVGVVCKRAMMKPRRASQSSDTMEHPREGVGDQEPHYFTFEVSWEVANKGMPCEIFANCAFSLRERKGLVPTMIYPHTSSLKNSFSKLWFQN